MQLVTSIASPAVVGDCDVLLCAGFVDKQYGLGMLYKRLNPRLCIPPAVIDELAKHRRSNNGHLRGSAEKILGRRAVFINRIEDNSQLNARRAVRREIELAEERLAKSRGRDYRPKPYGHSGEIQGILAAHNAGGIFLSNDRAALFVAHSRGIPIATYPTLLAAEIRDGALLAEDASQVCSSIVDIGWSCGVSDFSALRLTELIVPDGI
ncbi:hypothetical protein Val02_85540 [Virgisporangium aliadipatigenens]|uniref:Uncharacterized protein n=1 Tax=Virgisporangium aliadipatigenens TaxID=741659 RepID=A0A8J3YY25_9ACTN|nr:hypothetical protein [Virgisporangium aliadipatigenens]GIJ51668.1 hypothetical protein Val02_85540 [Virgisporangium aliadipatigenens]